MTPPPPRPPRPPQPSTPPSNREKMADAVQALVKQVKDQKEMTKAEASQAQQRAKQKKRTRIFQVIGLTLALAASIAYTIPRWRQPLQAPGGEEARLEARKALVFASRLLDQYQRRSGRLPGTFAQVGVTLPGIVYTRTGDTYTVGFSVQGTDIVFHQGDDPVRFLSSH
jgi:hypothetical protein